MDSLDILSLAEEIRKYTEIWNVTRDNYRDENRNNPERIKIYEQVYTNFREMSNTGKAAISKSFPLKKNYTYTRMV